MASEGTDTAKAVMLPSTIVGSIFLVAGIVLGSVGGACLNDTLVGVHDCPHKTTVLLLKLGFIFDGLGLFSIGVTIARVILKERFDIVILLKWKTDEKLKDRLISILGSLLAAVGIILISTGSACIDETFVNIDDCRTNGVIMLMIGLELLVVGVLLRAWTYNKNDNDSLPRSLYFQVSTAGFCASLLVCSAGLSCTLGTMAGSGEAESCNDWGGVYLALGGNALCLFSLILFGSILWHSTDIAKHGGVIGLLDKVKCLKKLAPVCKPEIHATVALAVVVISLGMISIGLSCVNRTFYGVVSTLFT
eukprot:SAG11_NODE_423_length_9596_cov_4.427293_2_plen_306_part_00